MSYATRADLESRFGTAEISDVAGAGDAGTARINAALADAAAEIDAEVGREYALPLGDGPWPMLVAIQCDLARAALYDESIPDRVRARASGARKRLMRIGDQELRLLDAAGAEAARLPSVQVSGPEPQMTRDNLSGFG